MTDRTRGDLCPGVFRPWPADDGALVRLRVPGGHLSRTTLLALLDVAESYGDGRVHLTKRANLQLRALPHDGRRTPRRGRRRHPRHRPAPAPRPRAGPQHPRLAADRPARRPRRPPPGHRRARRADLRHAVARQAAGSLPLRPRRRPRRPRPALAATSAWSPSRRTRSSSRIGSSHWGPVVPLHEAAARLTGLARAFQQVRGTGDDAAWHVDELPVPLPSEDPDPRALVRAPGVRRAESRRSRARRSRLVRLEVPRPHLVEVRRAVDASGRADRSVAASAVSTSGVRAPPGSARRRPPTTWRAALDPTVGRPSSRRPVVEVRAKRAVDETHAGRPDQALGCPRHATQEPGASPGRFRHCQSSRRGTSQTLPARRTCLPRGANPEEP